MRKFKVKRILTWNEVEAFDAKGARQDRARDFKTWNESEWEITEIIEPIPHYVEYGHGHVFPRRDGFKAACGGINLCHICADDFVLKQELERK